MPAFNYRTAINRDNIAIIDDAITRNSVNDLIIN
jgi:hypothetical protein